MRLSPLVALVCLLAATASGAAPDAKLVEPIRKFVDSFNRGDMAAAKATHEKDVSILDEVAPYLWRGPEAFDTWGADLTRDAEARGITKQLMTLSDATRVDAKDGRAYVVVPGTFTFEERGKAMEEKGHFAFVLREGEAGWRIVGWAWTGPTPSAVPTRRSWPSSIVCRPSRSP